MNYKPLNCEAYNSLLNKKISVVMCDEHMDDTGFR